MKDKYASTGKHAHSRGKAAEFEFSDYMYKFQDT